MTAAGGPARMRALAAVMFPLRCSPLLRGAADELGALYDDVGEKPQLVAGQLLVG